MTKKKKLHGGIAEKSLEKEAERGILQPSKTTIYHAACQTSNQTVNLNGKTRKNNVEFFRIMEVQCAIHLLYNYLRSFLFRMIFGIIPITKYSC